MVKLYIRSTTLIKIAKYTVFTIIASMLMTVLFPRLTLIDTTPDLILAMVVASAMAEGERTAGVLGLCAGFVIDALGSTGLLLSPLFYALAGYISGVCMKFFLRRNLPSYGVYMLIAGLFRAAVTNISLQFSRPDCTVISAFADYLVPEYVCTVIFSLPVFLIVWAAKTEDTVSRFKD